MNAGVAAAQGDRLVLLNSDTLATDHWLDLLCAALDADPQLGLVGPVTNRCGHDVQRDPASANLAPEDAQAYAAKLLAAIPSAEAVVAEPQRLVFFCVLLRRSVWEQLGGLDPAFGVGNFEDDDLCLRARLAGWNLAVVRNAFVFHNESRTFLENRIDHQQTFQANRARFGDRLALWSSTPAAQLPDNTGAAAVSVLLPVVSRRADGLYRSLASLTHQALQGFEVIVALPASLSLPSECEALAHTLSATVLRVEGEDVDNAATLLNAARAAATRRLVTYLPAGDLFYPFHLEVLLAAVTRHAARFLFSGWSIVRQDHGTLRREAVEYIDAIGEWVPLVCCIHDRLAASDIALDPSFGDFSQWDFVLRLTQQLASMYQLRVTCERWPDPPSPEGPQQVAAVMAAHPVTQPPRLAQRQLLLNAVRQGPWEDALLLARQERLRRAKQMMAARGATDPAGTQLKLLTQQFAGSTFASTSHPREGKADILLFSILEWSTLEQRPHHLARGLVARGHRVFWIDASLAPPAQLTPATLARELEPGLFHVRLPGTANAIYRVAWTPDLLDAMRSCLDLLRRAFHISAAVQLVHFQRWQPLCTLLRERFAWKLAYDCLDDQRAFAELFGHPYDDTEPQLLATADHVFASGIVLRQLKQAQRPDTVLLPNGVPFELFANARSNAELRDLPRPIAGFFGAFADWLDLDWIAAASREFPHVSFVFLGADSFSTPAARLRWSSLAALPNVHILPKVPLHALPGYLADFDLCLMPFRDLPITRSMNAVKLYEYLAAGKPVLVPDLPETALLREAGVAETYATQAESFTKLREILAHPHDEEATHQRQSFAAANTWQHRLEVLTAELSL